jgi:hypothetical protein
MNKFGGSRLQPRRQDANKYWALAPEACIALRFDGFM